MAEMEGLYLGMGIDTSQLRSDFVDAERTINQNLARLNNEMRLVKIKGQLKLEGLDESISDAEKLKVKEEALTEQMNLQNDKVILLAASYDHLVRTRGENANATKQLEYQLTREQLAMQRLENQLADLTEQEKIAFGFNFEALSLVEPSFKLIDAAATAGRIASTSVFPAKAAATALAGLVAFTAGTVEATNELREENPAKVLDESFQRASVGVNDSWQKISDSTRRGSAEMQDHTKRAMDAVQEQTKRATPLEFKIFPEINEGDFIRFLRVMEDFRTSESALNALELINQSESVIGKLLAVLTGLSYAAMTINVPTVEIAQPAIDSFKELKKAATELNLPLDRTNDLITKINLAGEEYDSIRDYVRGIQDAVIKGDAEDPEVIALEKYGIVIQDAQGKLLDFDETLDRLYQGYLKAREAGEAEAYVIMTNGQAVQDILPYFEKLAQAEEDMAKIKWSTVDPASLSEASRNMKLVEAQTNEFKMALSSLAVPAANIALEGAFEKFKKLTELVEENREEIIYWSLVIIEAANAFQDFIKGLGDAAKDKLLEGWEALKGIEEEFGVIEKLSKLFADEPTKDLAEEAKENLIPFYTELKSIEEEFNVISKLGNFLPEGFTEELDTATNEYLVPFYQEIKNIKEALSITNKLKSFLPDWLTKDSGEESIFSSILNRAKEDFEEFKKANEEARKEIEKTKDESAGLGYSWNRVAKYKSELERLNFDLQYGEGFSYQKLAAQNKLWYDEAMRDAKQYAAEKAIIEEIYAVKSELVEREREKKLEEIRGNISSSDKNAWQQRIDLIEKEKETWIQAGMEETEATELAQKKIDRAYKEAAEEVQKYLKEAADIEYEMTHSAFEKELRDIERWEEAQHEKGELIEKTAAIAAEAAAKEAQAFEREVDIIKGKMQSLDDKIFELDHSQYENDLRKLQQEIIGMAEDFQARGMLNEETRAKLEYYYQRTKSKYDERGKENKDYKKSPTEDGMQRGGNGIMVIGGDTIFDDGLLKSRRTEISLLTDENKIREQLLPNLSNEARDLLAAQQAAKNFTDVQNFFAQAATEAANGFQLIEGDNVVSTPELSTEPLEQFNSALQQTTTEIEQANPAETIANAERQLSEKLNQATQTLPTDYFKNMAVGMENVSTMQLKLTESTMKLIDAQELYGNALKNMPTGTNSETKEGIQQLSYSNRKELEPLPTSPRSQSREINFGFDSDIAGLVAGLAPLFAMLGGAPMTLPIAGGITALSALAGLAKGSYDASTEPQQNAFGTTDLTALSMPLASIDTNVQSIMQTLQPKETTLTFETLVTPLNSIESFVSQIFAALSNREPSQVNVSPNVDINLGGAYVFDDEMKQSLVNDITSSIVEEIKSSVESATSRTSYGYGV